MEIAILSDIHSNISALNEVTKYLKKNHITKIVSVGDVVGYYLKPNEVIKELQKFSVVGVKGNHDKAISHQPIGFNRFALQSLKHNKLLLTKKNKLFLEALPEKIMVNILDKNFLIIHGSIEEPIEGYLFSKDITKDYFDKHNLSKFDVVIFGQTHIPYIKRFGKTLVLNPGSVGQPRDGNPNTSFIIYDSDTHKAKLIRLSYNINLAANDTKEVLYVQTANRLFEGR